MKIELEPKRVFKSLLRIILILLAANILGFVLRVQHLLPPRLELPSLFDFNTEQNIPTLYSSIALVCCAALLFLIGNAHHTSGTSHLPWFGLGWIFIYLSVDESSSIHERLSALLQASLNTSGAFYYAWVIPYGLAVLLLLGIYWRFLLRLPRRTMLLFLLSAAIFIGGAIGIEMLSAYWQALLNQVKVFEFISYSFEDLLEMLGVATFIYSLLSYAQGQFGSLHISMIWPIQTQ